MAKNIPGTQPSRRNCPHSDRRGEHRTATITMAFGTAAQHAVPCVQHHGTSAAVQRAASCVQRAPAVQRAMPWCHKDPCLAVCHPPSAGGARTPMTCDELHAHKAWWPRCTGVYSKYITRGDGACEVARREMLLATPAVNAVKPTPRQVVFRCPVRHSSVAPGQAHVHAPAMVSFSRKLGWADGARCGAVR